MDGFWYAVLPYVLAGGYNNFTPQVPPKQMDLYEKSSKQL